jgi:hypothetical protein
VGIAFFAFVFVGRLHAVRLAQRRRERRGFLIDRTCRCEERTLAFRGLASAFEGYVSVSFRIEEDAHLRLRLINVHEIARDRSCHDFFFFCAFRFALHGAPRGGAPREPIFGDGRARSRDFPFARGGGAMHEGFKAGHLRRHRPAFGREADGQAVAGDNEFEHRRGRAGAGRHEQQRHRHDQRDRATITTPNRWDATRSLRQSRSHVYDPLLESARQTTYSACHFKCPPVSTPAQAWNSGRSYQRPTRPKQ